MWWGTEDGGHAWRWRWRNKGHCDARQSHCPDPLTAVPAVQPSSVTKATRPACNVQHVRLHTCMAVLARSIR